MSRPARLVVAGLGPAGPELLPEATRAAIAGAELCFFRTLRHPGAREAAALARTPVRSFDDRYTAAASFDVLYAGIAETVAEAALSGTEAPVVYAVPGSPFIAERTVALLRSDPRIDLECIPAPSFVDLAWDRLGVDPVALGVRLIDGAAFATEAAGERGPMLVAQCDRTEVLSAVKLSVDDPSADRAPSVAQRRVVLLQHLGLPDERVVEVDWDELDRTLEPDHLTSLWIPELAAPVAGELQRLDELVRVLRARCPWDRDQTHASLGRHLLEEAYEVLDAVAALDAAEPDPPAALVEHLEEELGDLLVQVFFHATLGAEAGRFTMADVAGSVHDKLVGRHPHVFGDAEAETADDVAARWEQLKAAEKGRASVFDGIPASLPALALSAKLQRKAATLPLSLPGVDERRLELLAALERLVKAGAGDEPGGGGSGETLRDDPECFGATGELLFAVADLARRVGVDPEAALRASALGFGQRMRLAESDLEGTGVS